LADDWDETGSAGQTDVFGTDDYRRTDDVNAPRWRLHCLDGDGSDL